MCHSSLEISQGKFGCGGPQPTVFGVLLGRGVDRRVTLGGDVEHHGPYPAQPRGKPEPFTRQVVLFGQRSRIGSL
jgi:hypothetical protein